VVELEIADARVPLQHLRGGGRPDDGDLGLPEAAPDLPQQRRQPEGVPDVETGLVDEDARRAVPRRRNAGGL
jgi:hypothetical protein